VIPINCSSVDAHGFCKKATRRVFFGLISVRSPCVKVEKADTLCAIQVLRVVSVKQKTDAQEN